MMHKVIIFLGIWTFFCAAIPPCFSESVQDKTKETSPMNRLQYESSPYLLQHADNPVDWYPWGEEAFEKAASEDKPVFLSIGYSTCHWCHVMEHESFEDEGISGYLNKYFVSIKVDREERPDIDHIYMQTVMAMTGRGGWPLTVFLTPSKIPVYGGTYFPPTSRYGNPGFLDLLKFVATRWEADPESLVAMGNKITDAVRQRSDRLPGRKGTLDPKILHSAFEQLNGQFDAQYGGFGSSPKFPMGHTLSYLLTYWKRTDSQKALQMVEKTLTEMGKGGMYDHLAGGFHRYSTDAFWQTPHFEKMLYDQAVLSKVYVEAFQATGNKTYEGVARGILDYVLRMMTDSQGGFYSAEDADSLDPALQQSTSDQKILSEHKKEGAFYVWSEAEIEGLLNKDEMLFARSYFGLQKNGNVRYDPHGEFGGKNILFISQDLELAAQKSGFESSKALELLDSIRLKLNRARDLRPRPHLDDKVLTDWNGLMIAGFASAYQTFGDREYLEAGQRASDFIWNNLRRADGRLLHRYRAGDAGLVATIDDYAFYVHGLIEMYQATWDAVYLQRAVTLTEDMVRLFWDHKQGGFYMTADDHETLLFRPREITDGAIPSGSSVAVMNLERLYFLTYNRKWLETARSSFEMMVDDIAAHPSGSCQALAALDLEFGPQQQIVIVDEPDGNLAAQVYKTIHASFNPHQVSILKPMTESDPNSRILTDLVPFIKEHTPVNGLPAVYVCENHTCQKPVTEFKDFIKIYQKK